MSTKSLSYDAPTYIVRTGSDQGECGGAATTQYGKFNAFTSMLAFNAVLTVTVAGTAAGGLIYVSKISGGVVTVLGTATPSTSAAGTVVQIPLNGAVAGGLSLLQGDVLAVVTGVDATVKVAACFEVGVAPTSTITA